MAQYQDTQCKSMVTDLQDGLTNYSSMVGLNLFDKYL